MDTVHRHTARPEHSHDSPLRRTDGRPSTPRCPHGKVP
jgi:hypothetical protein